MCTTLLMASTTWGFTRVHVVVVVCTNFFSVTRLRDHYWLDAFYKSSTTYHRRTTYHHWTRSSIHHHHGSSPLVVYCDPCSSRFANHPRRLIAPYIIIIYSHRIAHNTIRYNNNITSLYTFYLYRGNTYCGIFGEHRGWKLNYAREYIISIRSPHLTFCYLTYTPVYNMLRVYIRIRSTWSSVIYYVTERDVKTRRWNSSNIDPWNLRFFFLFILCIL